MNGLKSVQRLGLKPHIMAHDLKHSNSDRLGAGTVHNMGAFTIKAVKSVLHSWAALWPVVKEVLEKIFYSSQ